MDHSWYTSGMLATKIRALLGNAEFNVSNVWWKSVRNDSTAVIVSGDEVHRSLAPIKMVTYCTRRAAACCACAGASLIRAPDAAALYAVMPGLTARRRSKWLLTPSHQAAAVLQELAGWSPYQQHTLVA